MHLLQEDLTWNNLNNFEEVLEAKLEKRPEFKTVRQLDTATLDRNIVCALQNIASTMPHRIDALENQAQTLAIESRKYIQHVYGALE